MSDKGKLIAAVEAALRDEPAVGFRRGDFYLEIDHTGALILGGEVGSVAAKKLALEHVAAVPRLNGIVDRLRVKPKTPMTDNDIRTHLCDAFMDDSSFIEFSIFEQKGNTLEAMRECGEDARGFVEVEVTDGVVILNGEVPGLEFKRLAGVLAWWVPGSRDVINGLAVEPPEEDSPDAIEESVRIALDKNPFIDAAQVRVGVRHRVVRLTGALADEHERHMAECDAWYVFGVDKVINEIELITPES